MQHFEDGGEVEYKEWCNSTSQWHLVETNEPIWSWARCDYRIKPKPVELVFEWCYEIWGGPYIDNKMRTEKAALEHYTIENTIPSYRKTGRYFNPETKEFGEIEK